MVMLLGSAVVYTSPEHHRVPSARAPRHATIAARELVPLSSIGTGTHVRLSLGVADPRDAALASRVLRHGIRCDRADSRCAVVGAGPFIMTVTG
jgi:hypothetical protein